MKSSSTEVHAYIQPHSADKCRGGRLCGWPSLPFQAPLHPAGGTACCSSAAACAPPGASGTCGPRPVGAGWPQQHGVRPGDSGKCCDTHCGTSWGEAGATSTLEVGHLGYIWTAGESRRLQVLPVAQNGILGKRLKSEPLAWIPALATHFSSHSGRGWC